MKIPERILEEIDMCIFMLEDSRDWLSLKKIILRTIPSELRAHFSTRDPKTKLQTLNEFELKLIDIYKKRTGIHLVLED